LTAKKGGGREKETGLLKTVFSNRGFDVHHQGFGQKGGRRRIAGAIFAYMRRRARLLTAEKEEILRNEAADSELTVLA